ncbi:MAG: Gfo/Idh/MocA family protein, partial [Planctomycetota bacterium]
MVGGGRDAFIGAVHRAAARLDGEIEVVAGALSSSPEKALASGRDLGLAEDRNYPDWEALLAGERDRGPGDRIDLVAIVTPNDSHFAIARAFADAGFHVVCDKPMVNTPDEAGDLVRLVDERGVVFCVTY